MLDEMLKSLDAVEVKSNSKNTRAKKGAVAKPPKPKKATKKAIALAEICSETVLPDSYETVWTQEQLIDMCKFLKAQEVIALDTETTGLNTFVNKIVGFSVFAGGRGFYVPLRHIDDINTNAEAMLLYSNAVNLYDPDGELKRFVKRMQVGVDYVECLDETMVGNLVRPILEDPKKKFILHNAKFDQHIFYNWLNITVTPYFDTMIAAALLDENRSKSLKDLAFIYLKVKADKFQTLFGKLTFDFVQILIDPATRKGNLASYYAIKDTEMTLRLYEFFSKHLENERLARIKTLFFEVEMPFANIVWQSEQRGVRFDVDYIKNTVSPVLIEETEALRQSIKSYLGDINLKSPAQLSYVLYEKLKLPRVNIKKPNSTDKKTLGMLKKEHQVIGDILEFRTKSKLLDAFCDKLVAKVVDGKIHTSFNVMGAVTGRLSSSSPNLQQIPQGNLIRNSFIADDGRLLVSIDFSSQELRLLAHISKDPVLLDIYKNEKDVHSMTGTTIWNLGHPDDPATYEEFQYYRSLTELFCDKDGNIDKDKINDAEYVAKLVLEGKLAEDKATRIQLTIDVGKGKLMDKCRKKAKTVNFGVVYGIQSKKLGEQLDISEHEAQDYIDGFFDTYKGVDKWMKGIQKQVIKTKYVETLLGRKRRLYEAVDSGIKWKIHSAYRQAGNFCIQGSAADQTKLATVKLQPLLKELGINILLYIHDEIIFDCPEGIGMESLKRIADVMCNVIQLDCGMKSDIEAGKRWNQRMSEDELEALRLRLALDDDDEYRDGEVESEVEEE